MPSRSHPSPPTQAHKFLRHTHTLTSRASRGSHDAADILRLFLEQQHVWGCRRGGEKLPWGEGSPGPQSQTPAVPPGRPQEQPQSGTRSRTPSPAGPARLPAPPCPSPPSGSALPVGRPSSSPLPLLTSPRRCFQTPPLRPRTPLVSTSAPSRRAPCPFPCPGPPTPHHRSRSPPGLDLPPTALLPEGCSDPPAPATPEHSGPPRHHMTLRSQPRGASRRGGTPQPGPPESGAAWAARAGRGALG